MRTSASLRMPVILYRRVKADLCRLDTLLISAEFQPGLGAEQFATADHEFLTVSSVVRDHSGLRPVQIPTGARRRSKCEDVTYCNVPTLSQASTVWPDRFRPTRWKTLVSQKRR